LALLVLVLTLALSGAADWLR